MASRAITHHFRISSLKNGYGMVAAARGGAKFVPQRSFATVDAAGHYHHHPKSNRLTGALKADMAPIYILGGLLLTALSMGVHTAKQELLHSPSVLINKKRREGSPEVNDPDSLITESDKFLNKSFLRKVGHIQANHNINHTDPDVRPNPYTKSWSSESLKSVGA